MSYFGLADMNSVSSLFSGFTGSSASSTGSSNILADYAGIRNGSYHKLLKAYYNKTGSSAVSDIVGNSSSTSTAKDSTKALTKIENAADELKDSADALITKGTKSVFKKVTSTDKDGNTTTGYDTNAIYDKVNAFVEDYNSLVETTADSNTNTIAKSSAQMIQSTDANAKLLRDIGISINKDDTLSIDKDTFLKADMEKVKTLFNGNGSYAYHVSAKASMVDYYAQKEAEKANTYGKNGSYDYNYSYGGNYSSYI